MPGTVVLGIASSVSAYKACEVLRGFQRAGCVVQPVMTRNATRLVAPRLLSTLSGRRAIVELFDDATDWSVAHVALAREASLLCVAPATANVIAKLAAGIADDFLTTFYLAARCPVLVAPAMNEAMLLHPRTRDNLARLEAAGVTVVGPGTGFLACGDEGRGRLADPAAIVEAGLRLMGRARTLAGRKVLVTAGPTREPIDPVRFLSNPSSGKMGFALAAEAAARGADVVLVTGPSAEPEPAGVAVVRVGTAEEMRRAVGRAWPDVEVVVMAAAVSDFRFRRVLPRKARKAELAGPVELVPTPDILAELGRTKGKRILVGFAAETGDLVARAAAKMKAKNVDLMVANDVRAKDAGFGSENNRVTFLWPDGRKKAPPRGTKREIGGRVWDEVEALLAKAR